jgi:peptidoglycan DL-endopeptidase CwlO
MHILSIFTESKNPKVKHPTFKSSLAILVAGVFSLSAIFTAAAAADTFDVKINKLKQDNAKRQSAVDNLQTSETSLRATVAALRTRIAATENQIRKNQAKINGINNNIAATETEISEQRQVLGINIKEMYLDDQISTVEMLASSKDLSEFVDRQQYKEAVQAKIQAAMERIEQLKQELNSQKSASEKLLKDQQSMHTQLARERAESNRLLSLNKNQQAAFERDIKGAKNKITELRRQQAIENARHNVGAVDYSGTGSYPWANVYFPNMLVDPWGMYKRQCVSYTAWKVASTGRHMPYWGGRGNANNWDDNARAAGIPVDGTPRIGDVGVSNAGVYGHVVYVEAVHGDGTITVSQYNAGWDGRYSVVRRGIGGLVFIHF